MSSRILLRNRPLIIRVYMGLIFVLGGCFAIFAWTKGEPILISYHPIIEFSAEPIHSLVAIAYIIIMVWGILILADILKKFIDKNS